MRYKDICAGVFLHRRNRFVAEVEIGGVTELAHVKNTGRLKELLVEGVRAIFQRAVNPDRITKYDLIAVWKGEKLVNIDSQAPNKAFGSYLQSGRYIENITLLKPEMKYGASRFDFYVEAGERKIFIEVKGVTLEEGGAALFPDAPTERGIKHLNQLANSIGEGYEAHAVYVIQMGGASHFAPNDKMHKKYAEALVVANAAGVKVAAYDCLVQPDRMLINDRIPYSLPGVES